MSSSTQTMAEIAEDLGLNSVDIGEFDDSEFSDVDGKRVKCYDDVKMIRAQNVSSYIGDAMTLPDCTATVLMSTNGLKPIAQLEVYVGGSDTFIGYEDVRYLRLFETTNQKWPN